MGPTPDSKSQHSILLLDTVDFLIRVHGDGDYCACTLICNFTHRMNQTVPALQGSGKLSAAILPLGAGVGA